jgi:hypothetical protein
MVRACTPKWRFGTQAWVPSGHGAFVKNGLKSKNKNGKSEGRIL